MQAVLRIWFVQWGLPRQLRVDNGLPWGSWADLPPELALWLIGLGVEMVWNRPRQSRDNAVIERAHGVCQRWVEPGACPDPETLQARLDRFTTLQRAAYPVRNGQSRMAACPALVAGGRPYAPDQEADQWDERRVWAFLAARVWTRHVDQVGRISLYNRALGVGRAWAGTTVTVRLAVAEEGPHWTIADAKGTRIRAHPAPELARDRILGLTVSHHRRPPDQAQPLGQPGG